MITKRQMLELIQHRLNGGDTPEDLRRLYPLSVIARIVNFAFADLVTRNFDSASSMTITYDFEVDSTNAGYFLILDPKPIAGAQGIFSVEDENGQIYNPMTKMDNKAIKAMRGNSGNKYAAIYDKDTLRFNTQPFGTVTVEMIPNIYQMADDDVLIANESEGVGESQIFALCLQMMQTRQFQDDFNNNSIDAQYANK